MASEQTQFQPGNAGRPKGSVNKTTLYRAALEATLTEERELQLWEKLIDLAIAGDVSAARVVLEYRYSKPRQELEIQGDFGLQHLEFNVVPMPERAQSVIPQIGIETSNPLEDRNNDHSAR